MALLAGHALADVIIIGGLGNFDCPNNTGDDCNGFEIELDGPHPEDVYHTYRNGNYGSPTISALPGNARACCLCTRARSARPMSTASSISAWRCSLATRSPHAGSAGFRARW